MRKFSFVPAVASLASVVLATLAIAPPAQAQNGTLTRSFVSSSGVDSNPCTIAAPCASFAHAYTAVGANGIVAALDPGKYGPITITGPLTIDGNGWAAITAPSTGSGILVNAGTGDKVFLRGLTVDGGGTGNYGLSVSSVGALDITDCRFRNLSNSGIYSDSPDTIEITVSNVYVTNATYGLYLATNTVNAGSLFGTFDRLTVTNTGTAMSVTAVAAPISVTITKSDFSDNTTALIIGGQGTDITTVNLIKTLFSNNGTTMSVGSYSNVTLSKVNDTRSNNSIDFISSTSVTVASDGTSHVSLTGTGNPGSLAPYPFK
jgi:hypothetical protein